MGRYRPERASRKNKWHAKIPNLFICAHFLRIRLIAYEHKRSGRTGRDTPCRQGEQVGLKPFEYGTVYRTAVGPDMYGALATETHGFA